VELAFIAVGFLIVVALLVLMVRWVLGNNPRNRTDVITGFAQVIGGSALVAGLYFTAKNVRNAIRAVEVSSETLKVSQQTLANSEKSLALERRSKESERFFKAIEMLSNDESTYARVGALYSLGSLAKESEADRNQSYDVIVSFLRTKTLGLEQGDEEPPQPDVQAAIDVLAHRESDANKKSRRFLDFSGLTLKGVDFREGDFDFCFFNRAQLHNSQMGDCRLDWARFTKANCTGVRFDHSSLGYVTFEEANLDGADFDYKEYTSGEPGPNSKLHDVDFEDASMVGTHFSYVDLRKARGLKQEQVDQMFIWDEVQLPSSVHKKVENLIPSVDEDEQRSTANAISS
jgi:hypothetical protein